MHSKDAGNRWEEKVKQECEALEWSGQAKIHKLPDPVSIQDRGEGGKVLGYCMKREFADFSGTLKGGQAIVFEAKTTEEASRWPLKALRDKGKRNDQKSQLEILTAHRRMGAIAFVYLEQRADHPTWNKRYLLPVLSNGTVAGYGSDVASIPFDEIGRYELGKTQTFFDKLVELMRRAEGSNEIRDVKGEAVDAPKTRRVVEQAAPREEI